MTTETILFQDDFKNNLSPSWSWLREDSNLWRLENGGLEICVQPGLADTVINALLCDAPDRCKGSYAIEVTVTNHTLPTQQYEQAGITFYIDDKPVFKEVKELIDGDLYIIPGKQPMPTKSVRLRLVVTANSWKAQYRPEGTSEFTTAASGELASPGRDQVSLQCYNGPKGSDHWIRFEDFQIKKLP
ncbi:MAG: hypothetical protein VX910_11470 [Candidatus Latescibacterota bacterium]|nr:hypothetical protein [Candidatus Latescibacterota bacterium]